MKILHLSFENLNSLYGRWEIDLTHSDYTDGGLFALTGPTGAGKSTVLDALSLALFAQTPRLGPITAGSNEIMSRHSGECRAEVTFSCADGIYRVFFAQHRARRKPEGALQPPQLEFVEVPPDGGKGTVLATKKGEVQRLVEEKTGLDFQRFTRSTLLAQGRFDAFLHAREEEKSAILEEITGTAIYSEISRRVHERRRGQQESLARLEARLGGVALLDEEERAKLQQQLTGNRRILLTTATRLAQTGRALEWLQRLGGLQEELSAIGKEEETLAVDRTAFVLEAERLKAGRRAAALEVEFTALTAERTRRNEQSTSLQKKREALPQLQTQVRDAAAALSGAEKKREAAEKAQQEAAPLHLRVRRLDADLASGRERLAAQLQELAAMGRKGQQLRGQKLLLETRRTQLQQQREKRHRLLERSRNDASLPTQLAALEARLKALEEAAVEQKREAELLKGNVEQWTKIKGELEQALKGQKADSATGEQFHRQLQQLEKERNDLLAGRSRNELRQAVEHLEEKLKLLSRIASLEEQRDQLQAGQPCPLCGATEHPFAAEHPRLSNEEKELRALKACRGRIDTLDAQERTLREQEKQHLAATAERSRRVAALETDMKAEEVRGREQRQRCNQQESRVQNLLNELTEALAPYGLTPQQENLLHLLQQRCTARQELEEQGAELERQEGELRRDAARLATQFEELKRRLADSGRELEMGRASLEQSWQQRRELFGERDVEAEETQQRKAVASATATEKTAREKREILQSTLKVESAAIATLSTELKERLPKLTALEEEFVTLLAEQEFADEAAFAACRLAPLELERLAVAEQKLNERQQGLVARRKDRSTRLAVERQRGVVTLAEEKEGDGAIRTLLETTFRQLEEQQEELQATLVRLIEQLKSDDAAHTALAGLQQQVEQQRGVVQHWDRLHGLIGSADGRKYRNFAQGLTFELMVAHASRQLSRMTDRYLLERDRNEPLKLNVRDNWQGGELRPADNLSGGESFLVSLALALGLSKMASRRVQVESLFLDEGFGTLDEETLESALETLAGLQRDGRLIGIISHVGALKERIAARIEVVPVRGGRSGLQGPGVSRGEKRP